MSARRSNLLAVTDGPEPEDRLKALRDDLDHAESMASEALEKVERLDLVGESLDIVRRILADLIDAVAKVDPDAVVPTEYEDDLDRLDQIAHLSM